MADSLPRGDGRHPLCTCPDLTWANFATFDRAACAGGAIAHPVVTAEEARQLIAEFHRAHGV